MLQRESSEIPTQLILELVNVNLMNRQLIPYGWVNTYGIALYKKLAYWLDSNGIISRWIQMFTKFEILKKKSVNSLNPFLDSNLIMRMNGRLIQSPFRYNECYPMILPGNNVFPIVSYVFIQIPLPHSGLNKTCIINKQCPRAYIMGFNPGNI